MWEGLPASNNGQPAATHSHSQDPLDLPLQPRLALGDVHTAAKSNEVFQIWVQTSPGAVMALRLGASI